MMADILREAKPTIGLDKPPSEIRAACRALETGTASEAQQRRLWRFIVYELAGLNQIAFTLPAEESVQNWRAGCRYVGAYLESARLMPADDTPAPEPPARTATEAVRRRQRR